MYWHFDGENLCKVLKKQNLFSIIAIQICQRFVYLCLNTVFARLLNSGSLAFNLIRENNFHEMCYADKILIYGK